MANLLVLDGDAAGEGLGNAGLILRLLCGTGNLAARFLVLLVAVAGLYARNRWPWCGPYHQCRGHGGGVVQLGIIASRVAPSEGAND